MRGGVSDDSGTRLGAAETRQASSLQEGWAGREIIK